MAAQALPVLLLLNIKVHIMPNYAVIENGKVVNLCVATEEDVKPDNWVLCKVGGIGWDYVGGEFVDNRPRPLDPEIVPILEPTKAQLLAEVQALMAKINALE
jgi:hypothetical protein